MSSCCSKFNEKNRDLIVNINGRLVPREEAGVSPFDSAVQGGDAVWEGLRLYNGRIFKLHEHLARLRRSASALSFAEIPPNEKLIDEIKRTLAANQMRDGVHIRLTLTRGVKITSGMDPRLNQSGPTLIVLAEHKAPVYAKSGLTPDHQQDAPAAAGNPRSANSSRQFAQLDPGQDRSEQPPAPTTPSCSTCAASSQRPTRRISFSSGKARWLPSRVVACPEGITRATVLEICAAEKIARHEADLTIEEFYASGRSFLHRHDGRTGGGARRSMAAPIGNGQIGGMTQRLSEQYARRTSTEGVPVVD